MPGVKLDKEYFYTLPVWINLHIDNLKVWDTKALCRLASVVGRPIKLDHFMAAEDRLNYAKILVKVDISNAYTYFIEANVIMVELSKSQ